MAVVVSCLCGLVRVWVYLWFVVASCVRVCVYEILWEWCGVIRILRYVLGSGMYGVVWCGMEWRSCMYACLSVCAYVGCMYVSLLILWRRGRKTPSGGSLLVAILWLLPAFVVAVLFACLPAGVWMHSMAARHNATMFYARI